MAAPHGRSTWSLDNMVDGDSSNRPGARAWEAVAALCQSVDVDEPPSEFLRRFSEHSESRRLLFAALLCDCEVANGGFLQFFWNPTGVLAPEAARGLTALGLSDAARTTERAMRFFGDSYPRDYQSRRAALKACGADYPRTKNPFAALDDEYYDHRPSTDDGFERAADANATSNVV